MTIYVVLIFALSIPFWILGIVYPVEILPGIPISALAVLIPTLAACILLYRHDRLQGVLQLLQRSFDFKRVKEYKWFVLAVLINPFIAIPAYGTMRSAGMTLPDPNMTHVYLVSSHLALPLHFLQEING